MANEQGGNIKTFQAGDGPALNTDKSNEAATQISRSAAIEGSYYKQAGEAYTKAGKTLGEAIDNHEYMNEVSQGAAASAALYNSKLKEWQQIATQPGAVNDKNLQQNFLDNNLEPSLQQYQNAFSTDRGQNWALDQADRMRSEFFHTTSADVANLTGEARLQDAKTILNQYGDSITKDPTSTDHAMASFKSYVEAIKSSGELSPEQATKFDAFEHDGLNEMAKVQVKALADKGQFGMAKGLLDSGIHKDNITPPEQSELHNYITEKQRQAREQQSIDYLQQERAQKMQEQKIATDLFNKSYDTNTGDFTFSKENMNAIMSNPQLSAETKMNIAGAVKKIASESTADDPALIKTFAGRLKSDSASPLTNDDLLSAMSAGKMTPQTYNFFNERLKNTPDTHAENEMVTQTLDQWKNNILKPSFGQPNTPAAEQSYTRFQTWFLPAYQQALKDPALNGMSNAQKAQALLNPDSPKYMLGPETMKKFMAAGNDLIPGMVGAGAPLPTGSARTPLDDIFGPKK